MAAQEPADRGRDVQLAEAHRGRHRQPAARCARVASHRAFGLVHGRQHVPAALQIATAVLGQHHASRGAVEQPHAELRFERRERAHHRG
jgi:hypothetical protein